MKAVRIHAFGGPEQLLYEDVPDPEPRDGDVLVDIQAASVNAADLKVREGQVGAKPPLPHILGRDFCGVVSGAGQHAAFAVGELVFGVCPPTVEGAYAEQIAVSSQLLTRAPADHTPVRTAAIALTGLTAMFAVVDTLRIQDGEKLLIQGGAGGVGSMAIQFARHLGAHVVATASAGDLEYIRSLGAHEVIDYADTNAIGAALRCDAALDTAGGAATDATFRALRPGGRAAFIASGVEAPKSPRADVQSLRPAVARGFGPLQRLMALMEQSSARAPDTTTMPLSQAAHAHESIEKKRVRGKVVLLP